MSYKREVFLIKGRYYASGFDFFVDYGAVEDSLTIDDYYGVQAVRWFRPNLLIIRHGHKWGLFPSINVVAEDYTDYASENDNPFIYDSFRILCHEDAEHNNELFDSFVLLNVGERWYAVRIEIGKGLVTELNIESDLETDSDSALLEAIEERYKMKLKFRDLSQNDGDSNDSDDKEELTDFNIDRDFKKRYYNPCDCCSDTTSFTRMILFGLSDPYWGGIEHDISFYYAAAHRSPHAALIIGKLLLDRVTEGIANDKKNGDKYYKPDISYYYTRLDRSIEYLRLAKRYADESGDTTLSDIAWLYLEKAEDFDREIKPKAKQQQGRLATIPQEWIAKGCPIPLGMKKK